MWPGPMFHQERATVERPVVLRGPGRAALVLYSGEISVVEHNSAKYGPIFLPICAIFGAKSFYLSITFPNIAFALGPRNDLAWTDRAPP